MIEAVTRFFKKFWGFSFVAFALVGLGTEYDHYQNGTSSNLGVAVVMISLFAIAGGALLRSAYRKQGPAALPAAELDIAGCAAGLGGRVTVTDIASELHLPFDRAKKELARLEKDGACTTETIDGTVYYDFGRSVSNATSLRLKKRIGGPQ